MCLSSFFSLSSIFKRQTTYSYPHPPSHAHTLGFTLDHLTLSLPVSLAHSRSHSHLPFLISPSHSISILNLTLTRNLASTLSLTRFAPGAASLRQAAVPDPATRRANEIMSTEVQLGGLVALNASMNHLTDVSAKQFGAALAHDTWMVALNLRGNLITRVGG